jgi:hypothetical protein
MSGDFERHPFLLPVQDVVKILTTDLDRGLTSAQVTEFQQKYPPNVLDVGGAIPVSIYQCCSFMLVDCRRDELPIRWSTGPALALISWMITLKWYSANVLPYSGTKSSSSSCSML